MNLSRLMFLTTLAALSPLVALPKAASALTSVTGTWTGAIPSPPFSNNSAFVTMTADMNLTAPTFDAGAVGGKLHSWWFNPTSFSNVVVVVTGSSNAAANGTFNTASFNWLRIYSNASTSASALSDPTYIMDLGASGVGQAPSDAGGAGVMQVGSGGGIGQEYVGWVTASSSAAPEPGTLALLALGGTLVLVRRRRK